MAQSLKKLQSCFLLTFTIASIASDMRLNLRPSLSFAIIIVTRPVAGIPNWLHVSGNRDLAYINQNLSIIFLISLSTVTVPSSSIKI